MLTLNALTAADDMVIPVGLEVFSLQGLKQLFNTVENVRRYCNPRLKVAGILITRRGNRASLTQLCECDRKEFQGKMKNETWGT